MTWDDPAPIGLKLDIEVPNVCGPSEMLFVWPEMAKNGLRGQMALKVKISSKGPRRLKFGHKVHFGVYHPPKKLGALK